MSEKTKNITYVLLVVLPAVVLAITGFYGELWLAGSVRDTSNPQDPSGFLALFAPIVALVGGLVGLLLGGLAAILVYRHNKLKVKKTGKL